MNAKTLAKLSRYFLLISLLFVLVRACGLTTVEPGTVGVRYNNAFGLHEKDLGAGWHLEIVGLHRVWRLPSSYLYLNYTGQEALSIRTKDNNTVTVDVSVPYRIIPGRAWSVMDAGNHLTTAGRYRFERFANDTTISVLRENLAQLQSHDFYNTDRRLAISRATAKVLNKALKPLQLQASTVLIRASYFRPAYETQLAKIQLNEQQKLLDGAKRIVAKEQQKLDNYVQQTNAMVSTREQDWNRRIVELDRSYQVGFVDMGEDRAPGAARRLLAAMAEDKKKELKDKATKIFENEATDAHLMGIKNIQAETSEYGKRVKAAADGIAARINAEGDAMVAKVNGEFEAKLNRLLGSPGGRAYVAYHAARNISFAEVLTFQSAEGIPSVLRLRDFARKFMGK
jgi:regulator of protease activity HflC (stomatin/prohibitin superfamily)